MVIQAHAADVELVCSILEEAAHWLASRGIEQWPLRFARPPVVEAVRRGETYLAFVDGEPAGTLRLQDSDPDVWGDGPNDALYVHRLAIRRDYGGQGLGRTLLDWAEGAAARLGKRYLRLDCMLENEGLARYYLTAGFTERGTVSGRWRARRFEKRLDAASQPIGQS